MAEGMQVQGIGQLLPKPSQPADGESHFEAILKESDVRIADPDAVARDFEAAIDIRSLSSLNINHHTQFIELKQKLVAYYRDSIRIRPQLHKEKSKKWRSVLYSSLQKLLREVVFTQDRVLQEKCLERVFKWYYEKVERPEAVKPITYAEEVKEETGSQSPESRLKKYSRRQITSATTRSEYPGSRPVTASRPVTSSQKFKPQVADVPLVEKSASLAFTGLGDPVTESRADFGTSFVHYQPFDEDADRRVEQRMQQVQLKEQSDDRIELEMKEKVFAWAVARARQEEEMTRKTEGVRFASRFEARGVRSRPTTALPGLKGRSQSKSPLRASTPVVDLSVDPVLPLLEPPADMQSPKPEAPYYQNHEKIAKMRLVHGTLINAQEHYAENEKHFMDNKGDMLTSSAYSRKTALDRPKTAEVVRPGSAPRSRAVVTGGLKIEHRPLSASRSNQLEEIAEIKNKLARHGIPCRFDNLAAALLVPEDLPESQLRAENLPPDGARLMSNPFISLKKKKKKKKGKKKR
jgi:hypothetical protein